MLAYLRIYLYVTDVRFTEIECQGDMRYIEFYPFYLLILIERDKHV